VRFYFSVMTIVLAASATLVVVGETTRAAQTPATPATTATAAAGEFVWHDLVIHDPAASRAFYGSLFGWTFQAAKGVEPDYTIIKQDGYPIGGIVKAADAETVPQWLSYVMVPDVDRAADGFKQSGGRVYRGPFDVRKDLRVAVVGDAQGAPLGLANRGPATRAAKVPPINRWLWMEYVALDPAPALTFYSRVLGYTSEVLETRQGRSYHLLKTDRPRAGLFGTLWERQTSLWLPYVRVDDADAMAKRATALGGRVVLAPSADIRNGSLAIVLDPAGAPLALQEFPFERNATR
jgi:predicted enzyme related to lactoylglutathione lyase